MNIEMTKEAAIQSKLESLFIRCEKMNNHRELYSLSEVPWLEHGLLEITTLAVIMS